MNRDEWNALEDDGKPAVRFCLRVSQAEPELTPVTSVTGICSWCGEPILTDEAQEFPAEVRERGVLNVCDQCVLSHPLLAPSVIRHLAGTLEHWQRTGVINAIRIEE